MGTLSRGAGPSAGGGTARGMAQELLGVATVAAAAASDAVEFDFSEASVAAAIRTVITGRRPIDAVVMEGRAPTWPTEPSRICWVVDPIDGSVNAGRGLDPSVTSIAAFDAGRPAVGVVADLRSSETWSATGGGGAWDWAGRRCRVRPACTTIGDMVVAVGWSFDRAARPTELAVTSDVLEAAYDIRRSGSPAMDLVNLARGALDAVVGFDLRWWDVAAGLLLVHEAGGVARLASFPGTTCALLAGPADTVGALHRVLTEAEERSR